MNHFFSFQPYSASTTLHLSTASRFSFAQRSRFNDTSPSLQPNNRFRHSQMPPTSTTAGIVSPDHITPPQFRVSYGQYSTAKSYAALSAHPSSSSPGSLSPINIKLDGVIKRDCSGWTPLPSPSQTPTTIPSPSSALSTLPSSASQRCTSMESACSPVEQCEWETHEVEVIEDISFTVGANGVVLLTQQPQRSLQEERQATLIDNISRLVDAQCVQNSLRVNDLDEEVAVWASTGFRTLQHPDGTNGLFFSVAPTSIAVQKYVAQFVKCLPVSEAVFIVALVYMDRVCAQELMLRVTHRNVHRLLTVAFTLAIKQLEDEPFDNATMASLGGLGSVKELNELEVEFLKRLDWRTGVELSLYETYRDLLWN